MRALTCKILLVCFLFVSIEGAADIVVDGVPHGDSTSHAEEFGHALDAHDGDTSTTELDGEHCDHCCHGHSVGMPHSGWLAAPAKNQDSIQQRFLDRLLDYRIAPPTPPPNAQHFS